MYANDDANIATSAPVNAHGIVAVKMIYSTGHVAGKQFANYKYCIKV